MQSYSFHESLAKWKASYKLLVGAVNSFRDASDDLLQTIPQSHTSHINRLWLEETLSQIREETSSLDLIEGKIAHSRVDIHRAINASTTLAPVNILPLEMLSRVFTFIPLTLYYARGFHKSLKEHPLVVVSSVCARWRKLAIGTRSLWSYIYMEEDFVSDKLNSHAHRWVEIWLDRSAGAPLTLNFYKDPSSTRQVEGRRITSFLQPHINKAAALGFSQSSSYVVEAVLTLYGSQNVSTSLKELSVVFVQPFTTAKLTWPVTALQGLHKLVLWGLPMTIHPDMDVIAQILLNNPRLHTLHIQQSTSIFENNNLPMASLPHLKRLTLHLEDNVGLGKQLSMLEPGAEELDVTLTLSHPLDLKSSHKIRTFFERAKVTRLSLDRLSADHAAQLCTYLDSTPCLRELSLSCMRKNDSIGLSALLVTSDDGEALARCPSLRSLVLSRMSIDQEQLKWAINTYRLSSIELGREVTFQNGPSGVTSGKDFLNWLRRRVDIVTSVGIDNAKNS
ncbi:hypothetical protein FRC12_000730 [Ceratobasidium sp. 428]|nr:hypothetical protein FRC12_000730 [Ceratobasidium sp. 428]